MSEFIIAFTSFFSTTVTSLVPIHMPNVDALLNVTEEVTTTKVTETTFTEPLNGSVGDAVEEKAVLTTVTTSTTEEIPPTSCVTFSPRCILLILTLTMNV